MTQAERFTLLAERGRGAMGVVWRAKDAETGSIVALKLLRELYAEEPDALERFAREVELARRVDAANVVAVLGFGARDGVPYLVMEYVDGPSLRERLREHGPYTWPEAKVLLAGLAAGLAAVHAAGIVHRDIKPSNILLTPEGSPKLSDFGIARGLDLTRVTGTSTMLGTPTYLPPEGYRDSRSDLYSLGVVAYELLAGSPPFEGHTYQDIILAHVRTQPDLSKLPVEARPLVGALLAKDPARRPASASEVVARLAGEAGAAVSASRHGPALVRRRTLAGLGALGLAMALVAAIIGYGAAGATPPPSGSASLVALGASAAVTATGSDTASVKSSLAPTASPALLGTPSPVPLATPRPTPKPAPRPTPRATQAPLPSTNQIVSIVGVPVAAPVCDANGCSAVDFTVRYAYSGAPTGIYVGIRVLPSSADGTNIDIVHVNGVETGNFGYVPTPNLAVGSGTTTVRVVWDGQVTGHPSTTTGFVRACMWANQKNPWPEFACVVVPYHYVWVAN